MAEKKAEIAPQKRTLKLTPALGDWTTYKPPRAMVKKIKIGLYGFDRLSDKELELAHLIHYLFCQDLLKYLRKNLSLGGELYTVDAFQNTYFNFLRNVHGPLFQGKIELPTLHDEIFISFNLPLIESIINAALGSQDTKPFNRGLSQAEELVANTFFEEAIKIFNQDFHSVLENPHFKAVSSPDLTPNPSIPPQTTFVVFIMDIVAGETLGKLIFGYSGPLLKKLLRQVQEKEGGKALSLDKLTSNILNNLDVPVSVKIGSTYLSAKEISALEEGDVVALDNSISNALSVELAESKKILGQPGVKNKRLVVRVVGVQEKDVKETKVAPPEIKKAEEKKEAPPAKPAAPLRPAPPPPQKPEIKPPDFLKRKPIAPLDIEEEEEGEEEEEFEEEFPEEDFEEDEFLEDEELADEEEMEEEEEEEEEKEEDES